jgi:glycosyltransferase involved in cell wall biosynthesis
VPDVRVVALVAAFNEADVIGSVVRDLVAQGIDVHVLDDGSTDGTVEALAPLVGRGVLAVERLPATEPRTFSLARLMRRKEALARELGADWFINHDADEFRESPWHDATLREAIGRVDALGYNAIDFELLNFWPTHDDFRPGDDPRQAFRHYARGDDFDRVQIRCWKNVGPVDLASTGGHEAAFPGRRVFPIRFLLRHYPIRSQAHGERKVLRERRPSFDTTERERGWHVQYEAVGAGARFLRDPATLTEYDGDAVRLGLVLRHRGVEALEAAAAALEAAMAARAQEAADLRAELTRREVTLAETAADRDARGAEIGRLRSALDTAREEAERVRRALADARGRLDAVYTSRSWRWTAPLRSAQRLVDRP